MHTSFISYIAQDENLSINLYTQEDEDFVWEGAEDMLPEQYPLACKPADNLACISTLYDGGAINV